MPNSMFDASKAHYIEKLFEMATNEISRGHVDVRKFISNVVDEGSQAIEKWNAVAKEKLPNVTKLQIPKDFAQMPEVDLKAAVKKFSDELTKDANVEQQIKDVGKTFKTHRRHGS